MGVSVDAWGFGVQRCGSVDSFLFEKMRHA